MSSNFSLQKPGRRNSQIRPYQSETEYSLVGFKNGIDILVRSRRLVISITVAVTLIGCVYAFIKKPIYEGNMLLQVAEKHSNDRKNMLGDIASSFDRETSSVSEIGVLKSRLVVSKVVDDLKLYIDARPKYLFFIGAKISAMRDTLSSPGIVGYGGYCWGSETITVGSFEVPGQLMDKQFIVTQEGNGNFRLTEKSSGINVRGFIGKPLRVEMHGGALMLSVAELSGEPGAQFLVTRRSSLALVEAMQKSLVVAETGKESGLISVALRGVDPQSIYQLLTSLGREYMREHQERKAKAAERSLTLLESQLPTLKQRMELAESKYNVYRNRSGTADLGEETKLRLQRLAGNEQSLLDLAQKRADLLVRYSPEHPALIGVDKQMQMLVAANKNLTDGIQRLPIVEQELGRLARNVKVSTDLYTTLLKTAQELKLISLQQDDGVYIVDHPVVPDTPVTPRSTIIVLSAALGLLLGMFGAFLKKVLAN